MNRYLLLATLAAPAALAACTPAGEPPAQSTSTPTGETATSAPMTEPTATGRPTGTGEPTPSGTIAPTESDACGAGKVRERWLNALPTADAKTAIAAAVGERRIRYYTEGDPITMDYSEDRLNVVLGKDGRIKEFRCG